MKVETEAGTDGLKESTDKIKDYRSLVNNTTKLEEEQFQKNIIVKEEDSKLNQFTSSIENKWMKIVNSVKKHLSLMIIFILIGGTCGLYIAKFIYDIRMDEIAQLAKTGSAGYIHKGQIFDVKLRP